MSTRRTTTADDLFTPLSNPDAAFRAANAEKRRLKAIRSAQTAQQTHVINPVDLPLPLSNPASPTLSPRPSETPLIANQRDLSSVSLTDTRENLSSISPPSALPQPKPKAASRPTTPASNQRLDPPRPTTPTAKQRPNPPAVLPPPSPFLSQPAMQSASPSTPADPSNSAAKLPAASSSATKKVGESKKELPSDPSKDPSSTRELVRILLATQQASIAQSLADREAAAAKRVANADRIARLEEVLLLLSVKQEVAEASPRPTDGGIDLQRFRIADGPVFQGPYQKVEPFLNWIRALEIFFETKGVSLDSDKVRIAGGLIRETNTLSFYANNAETHAHGSWKDFKAKLFAFALPALWDSKLREQIVRLEMSESESFLAYSTRARTLQSLVNFGSEFVSDFALAEAVTFGMIPELKGKVHDWELLLVSPFDYGGFERRATGFFDSIPKRTATRGRASAPPASNHPNVRPSREEVVWRIHSFLDSKGLCHYCKKNCGSAHGACPGPGDRSRVIIPTNFTAPAKPSDYKPPGATGPSSSSGAGRPTHAPAGRPSNRSASVAGVAQTEEFPDLDSAAVSALAALDEELNRSKQERIGNQLDK